MRHNTVRISDLVNDVNERNSKSTCTPEMRRGWNLLLEGILHNADNYHGYRFLSQREVPEGELPGIAGTEGKYTFPDDTRRHYNHP